MDLLALMIAMPTTTLYKLVTGGAPFAGKSGEKEFERKWPVSAMVIKSGLVKSAAVTPGAEVGASLSPDDKQFFAWASGISEMYYYVFSAVNDSGVLSLHPAGGRVMAFFTVGAEVAASIFSFPWFSSSKHANLNDHPEGAANAAWCWGTFAGIPLDAFFVWKYQKISENFNDLGVFVTLAYTTLTSVFAINACQAAPPLDQSLHVLPLFPGFFKVGLCQGWSAALSKYVAISDVVFGGIIASLTIAQGYQVGSEATPLVALPAA
jgi:hypothetical protein